MTAVARNAGAIDIVSPTVGPGHVQMLCVMWRLRVYDGTRERGVHALKVKSRHTFSEERVSFSLCQNLD
jgi:hypothetical protein